MLYTDSLHAAASSGLHFKNKVADAIHEVSTDEIRYHLKKMKDAKAADIFGIVAEMLKNAGNGFIACLAGLFGDILSLRAPVPSSWKNTYLNVLFKKGDPKAMDNYRPIAVIAILLKLFSRIVLGRIEVYLNDFQSVDQAGFKPGFSCDDHLFTIGIVVEKCKE